MCGIFGIFGHADAAKLTYLGLHALQHRGQESAGIVSSDGERLYGHRSMGLVQDSFTAGELEALRGHLAIGHVRYSTAGGSHLENAQPLGADYALGSIAVAHNGNLTNHTEVRSLLETRGAIFQTASDTEAIVHLIAISQQASVGERIVEALMQVQGAYSILFLTEHELIAARDPMGIRPLCLGLLPYGRGMGYVLSSEPVAFDLIGAKWERDVAPGEVVVCSRDGIRSSFPFTKTKPKMCSFEYVYFARPDSLLGGASVYEVRKALGRRLAEEQPVGLGKAPAVVIAVPDSGVPAALGYASKAQLPFEMGLVRNHHIGRTFIDPSDLDRNLGVPLKLNANRAVVEGKRVVVVDDSIVRGTTSRKVVKMIREAGAREVHVRISSPPTRWPCFYGIDTPTKTELIARKHSPSAIGAFIEADSLAYLSQQGLIDAVLSVENQGNTSTFDRADADSYCHACFSGCYPICLQSLAHHDAVDAPAGRE